MAANGQDHLVLVMKEIVYGILIVNGLDGIVIVKTCLRLGK